MFPDVYSSELLINHLMIKVHNTWSYHLINSGNWTVLISVSPKFSVYSILFILIFLNSAIHIWCLVIFLLRLVTSESKRLFLNCDNHCIMVNQGKYSVYWFIRCIARVHLFCLAFLISFWQTKRRGIWWSVFSIRAQRVIFYSYGMERRVLIEILESSFEID